MVRPRLWTERRKWSEATGVWAENPVVSDHFPQKGRESGGSNQSYIDCHGSVGFNPADFTTDPTDST